jgi:hypothetical protein
MIRNDALAGTPGFAPGARGGNEVQQALARGVPIVVAGATEEKPEVPSPVDSTCDEELQ